MADRPSAGQEQQQDILSTLGKSQEAVVEAIKVWVETVQSITPKVPPAQVPGLDKLPKPEEVVANAYDFAEQLLAGQREFAEEVLRAMSPLMPGEHEQAQTGRRVSREGFVTTFLMSVDTHGIRFPYDLKSYLLQEVIKSDDEWTAGPVEASSLVSQAEAILREAFDKVIRQAMDAGSDEVSPELLDRVLHEVIEAKWRCPWPFYFC
jgi:hypothetical protein